MLTLDADALEHLDALPGALDHLEVHAKRVSRLELRDVVAQLARLDALDDGAHAKDGPSGRRRMIAEPACGRCGHLVQLLATSRLKPL